MSPEAIQSLIEMFGVERGVQILNLFTAPGNSESEKVIHAPPHLKSRPKGSIQKAPIKEPVNV